MRSPGAQPAGGQLVDQELALDLNAGGSMRMEHYAACRRRRSSCCCRRRSTARPRSRCSPSASGSSPAARTRRIGSCSTASTAACAPPACGPSGRRAPRRRSRSTSPGAPARRVEIAAAKRHLRRATCRTARCGGGSTDVLEMRALLPVVRLRSSLLPLAVVNGDAKTVVRLVIERAEALDGSTARPARAAADGRAGARLRRRARAHAARAARPARARARGAPGVRRGGRRRSAGASAASPRSRRSSSPRARAPTPPPPRC